MPDENPVQSPVAAPTAPVTPPTPDMEDAEAKITDPFIAQKAAVGRMAAVLAPALRSFVDRGDALGIAVLYVVDHRYQASVMTWPEQPKSKRRSGPESDVIPVSPAEMEQYESCRYALASLLVRASVIFTERIARFADRLIGQLKIKPTDE